jgi:hypothetical protein
MILKCTLFICIEKNSPWVLMDRSPPPYLHLLLCVYLHVLWYVHALILNMLYHWYCPSIRHLFISRFRVISRRKINIVSCFTVQNSEVNNAWNVNQNQKGNYKIECRASRTSDKLEGRIRCHGGVSIFCRLITPAVCPSRNQVHGITRRQSQYGNDSLTNCMKQIILHIGQWQFVIANKVIITTVESVKRLF